MAPLSKETMRAFRFVAEFRKQFQIDDSQASTEFIGNRRVTSTQFERREELPENVCNRGRVSKDFGNARHLCECSGKHAVIPASLNHARPLQAATDNSPHAHAITQRAWHTLARASESGNVALVRLVTREPIVVASMQTSPNYRRLLRSLEILGISACWICTLANPAGSSEGAQSMSPGSGEPVNIVLSC